MNQKLALICLCLLCSIPAFSQKKYTLQQVIRLAKENSLASLQAENRKENSYWQFKTFRSNYKPQLSLNGTLPQFTRGIQPIPQNDGTTEFRPVSSAISDLELSLGQTIGLTGGQVFVSSRLERIDNFGGTGDKTRYASTPVSIGFVQPLFQFNSLNWEKKIAPLRYEESVKAYAEEMERIAYNATDLFFNLLLAQVSLEIADKNLASNDTIYRIAQGRYQLGKIAENDLLQLELNLITSQQQVREAKLNLETTTLNLNTYLGITENEPLELIEPTDITEFEVSVNIALDQAKLNRQQYISFQRQKIEAQREVARAKGDAGLKVDLRARFGLNQQGQQLSEAYRAPEDRETFSVGLEIPILDWGRQKSRVQTAQANLELVNNTLQQEEIKFEQDIMVLVKRFQILREKLVASIKADDIANRKYIVSQKRYMVDKISITDLNIALQEKDKAKQQYISSLKNYWQAYYEIRMLTMYDFEKNEKINRK
ncbi:TolC family protein [Rapidithrix thailandica]|uniref:TolC family protein n=1 Tax=Rapidithrix thailandica TaxID=413964 RepID=UPI003217EFFF